MSPNAIANSRWSSASKESVSLNSSGKLNGSAEKPSGSVRSGDRVGELGLRGDDGVEVLPGAVPAELRAC
jgi:hypothetical protein